MLTHLATFIKSELQIADDSVQHINEEFNNRFIMTYLGKTITVQYEEYGTDLVVMYEGNGLTTAENKILITAIAKGFNALLHQGKYQEDWEPIVREIE